MQLDYLPPELLESCFSHLSECRYDVRNLRLVSRKFCAISSRFLITEVNVRFHQQSFSDLEYLATHSVFSKSIDTVILNVSFFENHVLRNKATYISRRIRRLNSTLSSDFPSWEPQEDRPTLTTVRDEWLKARHDDFDRGSATPYQEVILAGLDEYAKLYEVQDKFIAESGWLRTLVSALQAFPRLMRIIIEDQRWRHHWDEPVVPFRKQVLSQGLENTTSRWSGTFSLQGCRPPVDILLGLFSALAETTIRPEVFELNISPPSDQQFIHMHMTELQLSAIRRTLENTKEVKCSIEDRPMAIYEDQKIDLDETGMGDFIKALFSSLNLRKLSLSMDGRGQGVDNPTGSLSKALIFPLPSQELREVSLYSPLFTVAELNQFVEGASPTLQSLSMIWPVILTPGGGSWRDALDVLRKLGALTKCMVYSPVGGEFGEDGVDCIVDRELFQSFILRKSDTNPMEELDEF
jgi:hypothetical protein